MSTTFHGASLRNGDATPPGGLVNPGKFGRMFPALPPFRPNPQALEDLGKAMIETAATPSGDNAGIPAGYTYLGQFIDHDITFDPTSISESSVDPLSLWNFRTPALDLDSVYGGGPRVQPYLYQRLDPALFQIGTTSKEVPLGDPSVPVNLPFDLPRSPNGLAITGDPRNDENLIVAQLHLAFLRFHNKVVDGLRKGTIPRLTPSKPSDFEEARTIVTWHYQWIVLNDFLARILDPQELKYVKNAGATLLYPQSNEPYLPVEFSAAAYRFGHSMVREEYTYNRVFPSGRLPAGTLALLFRFSGRSSFGNSVPIPSDWIADWRRLFDLGDASLINPSRLIDPYLAPTLAQVPAGPNNTLHLAVRNLQRGASLGLPSAQSIAKSLCYPALSPEAIAASGPDGELAAKHYLHFESPLWFYILKESQISAGGAHIGRLGSRIIAEVFFDLLERDEASFVQRDPEWVPTLGASEGHFTMADLLNFAGDVNPLG